MPDQLIDFTTQRERLEKLHHTADMLEITTADGLALKLMFHELLDILIEGGTHSGGA